MSFPNHKTKIVATLGPATDSPEMLARLLRAGMSVARLNFAHGDFSQHAERISRLRAAEQATGLRAAVLADLPGPKMRIGRIDPEPIEVSAGDAITLTTDQVTGTRARVAVSFLRLPEVVTSGDHLFLNDGLVQLEVESIAGPEVRCRILVGGELRSGKGLNLPGIVLGESAFTDHDRECLEFALAQGVDAVSQSFVERAQDLVSLRAAARAAGGNPFVIAKIERAGALHHIDEILESADGIMIARGDLGVEVPIEEIAITQKRLIAAANRVGKPVITATQMLESMIGSRLPTRAEATDVTNAILDGTDCLMLSGESAVGRFPEEAVSILGRIAAFTEPRRPDGWIPRGETLRSGPPESTPEAMAAVVEFALETVTCSAAFIPTESGTTARMISRFKPPVWIVAATTDHGVAQGLCFSYGVHPIEVAREPEEWPAFAIAWLEKEGIQGSRALLVTGPSPRDPAIGYRIEILRFGDQSNP